MKASIQLRPADKRQTPHRERLPTNNVNQLSFGATLFSAPKAQNGQRRNSNMLYKVSEKLKAKSNLTHHVPHFVFLQTKPPSPNPLSFGNWKRGKKKSVKIKFIFLSSNIPTDKLKNVNESMQITVRKCSTS